MAKRELRQCSLFTTHVDRQSLAEAIDAFFAVAENAEQKQTLAILYAPHKCFLAKHIGKDFEVKEERFDLSKVFEARIFNAVSEMRWLNDPNGNHRTAILSEKQFDFGGKSLQAEPNVIGGLNQEYLVWGQSTGKTDGDWTQFATARIGAFYIPLPNVSEREYARFKAIEYLRTYEDGNVAVFDERLTGIEGYKGGANNG